MQNRKKIAKILLLVLSLVLILSVLCACSNNSVGSKGSMDDWKGENGELPEIKYESNLGFIDTILLYLGKFISLITKIMPLHSYILALFIFAIIVEIIMLPFSIAQQKNSRKQAKLRPKEMAIRKKYAGRNDPVTQRKVQEEIQALYQQEQFNPASGCLPLLIQLPIIMALYNIVINPMKYVFGLGGDFVSFVSTYMQTNLGRSVPQNGTIGFMSEFKEAIANGGVEQFEGIKGCCSNGAEVYQKIEELAKTTEGINLNIGPVNLGYIPSFSPTDKILWLLLLVPVLTFVVQFFSMKITRKFTYQPTQGQANDPQAGCSTKMMDWMMPLMSVYIAFVVPAAVGVYWMFKGVIGTVKQIIISKVMPLPQFTEDDYKAAEKEYAGKQPKTAPRGPGNGNVRSLHHIDDEDYDEHGNYNPYREPDPAEYEENVDFSQFIEIEPEETSLPDNNMTEGATLKDESDKRGFFGRKSKKNKKYNQDADQDKYQK